MLEHWDLGCIFNAINPMMTFLYLSAQSNINFISGFLCLFDAVTKLVHLS